MPVGNRAALEQSKKNVHFYWLITLKRHKPSDRLSPMTDHFENHIKMRRLRRVFFLLKFIDIDFDNDIYIFAIYNFILNFIIS